MKHLYIDLPEYNHIDGFKNLHSLEIGDEIEVCLYEIPDKIHELLQSIEWRLAKIRPKAKIEMKFIDNHSFQGMHLIKFVADV